MMRYVLDSFAMIAFFENEKGAVRVESILKLLVRGKARGFMSVINWGEIYYSTLREQGVESAEAVIRQLQKYPIEVVDINKALTYADAQA